MLTLCWPKLPLSCPYVDPMFTYVGLENALPHSSDRNGGGGNGVTTGGSAAGGARLYNLRLLSPIAVTEKAEVGRRWGGGGEGVGRGWGGPGRRLGRHAFICWPAPGFKG